MVCRSPLNTRSDFDPRASLASFAVLVRRPFVARVSQAGSRGSARHLCARRADRRVLEAGMIVVLFRSKLVDAPQGYAEMAEEMEALARTMPGFIDVKAYLADDGERLTIVRWEDEATLKQWREQARHRIAQKAG